MDGETLATGVATGDAGTLGPGVAGGAVDGAEGDAVASGVAGPDAMDPDGAT